MEMGTMRNSSGTSGALRKELFFFQWVSKLAECKSGAPGGLFQNYMWKACLGMMSTRGRRKTESWKKIVGHII